MKTARPQNPSWRRAKSGAAHVLGFVDLKVSDSSNDLADDVSYARNESASTIQFALKWLVAEVVDSMPVEQADKLRSRLRQEYIDAMIRGVERARTLHAQIADEARELAAARKIKRKLRELEEWAGRFNNPKHTVRYVAEQQPFFLPEQPAPPLSAEHLALMEQDAAEHPPPRYDELFREPYYLDTSPLTRFYRAADYRIRIAENRFALAGGTRESGANEQGRVTAAVRYGTGEMAFWLRNTQGFNSSPRPTAIWKDRVADIANALFDVGGDEPITERNVKDWLEARVKIEGKRDGAGLEWLYRH